MKVCTVCGESLPPASFYKHPTGAGGYFSKCKDCVKRLVTENRNKNIDRYREYDRERASLPHRAEARRKYHEWYCEHKKREREALRLVNRAVQEKRLEREPCEVCGEIRVHGHHEDYAQPLSVRWLCAVHHSAVHHGKIKLGKRK